MDMGLCFQLEIDQMDWQQRLPLLCVFGYFILFYYFIGILYYCIENRNRLMTFYCLINYVLVLLFPVWNKGPTL